jgi:superfamily II DNA or RNA helicase
MDKNFKKYKLKKNAQSADEICNPKKFNLQPSQNFLGEYFPSNVADRNLLIYHKIGAGKTCTAINIAENLKNKMDIVVVVPAALIGNFRDELRSQCPGDVYLKENERKKFKDPNSSSYKKLLDVSDKRINRYYQIYSYHKFIKKCQNEKYKLVNTLLIIDEVQNMISENGTFYKKLKSVIERSPDSLRVILLSATPMFDKPVEIALTLNLLSPKIPLPIGSKFNQSFIDIKKNKNNFVYTIKNLNEFKESIVNLVSYYRGAPPVAFPEKRFNIVKCKMQEFQYKSYLNSISSSDGYIRGSFKSVDLLELPTSFLLAPRLISNVAFPNKSHGLMGQASFKDEYLQLGNVKNYSIKFYKILKKIKQSEGPVFVYSNFKEGGGIKAFSILLDAHGFKDYKTYGPGEKRYSIWSGDDSIKIKENLKSVFNKYENKTGDLIKIMLGTPSIKEGISLLRVEQAHILEPYWNMSRMNQVIGRAIRFCSHKDLPKNKRYVDVYLYLATHPDINSVDEHIWSLAKKKQKIIDIFETAIKEMAIDCNLFYERNVYKNETKLNCFNLEDKDKKIII